MSPAFHIKRDVTSHMKQVWKQIEDGVYLKPFLATWSYTFLFCLSGLTKQVHKRDLCSKLYNLIPATFRWVINSKNYEQWGKDESSEMFLNKLLIVLKYEDRFERNNKNVTLL